MGQRSIFAFCFQVRGLVFLQRTMINDESNILPCSKRAFSNFLEGVVVKNVLGRNHQTSFSYFLVLAVATGLVVSSNYMAQHAPFPKHWDNVISAILVYHQVNSPISDMIF